MILFRLLSRLPLGILYGISDFLYFLLFYLIRYRRSVVFDNLTRSFPEKSSVEIEKIAKGFYKNLTDILVETVKMPSMSAEELRERVQFTNPELVKEQLSAGQAVIGMASHSSNWEWIPSASVLHGMPADSIYKPLNNAFFE